GPPPGVNVLSEEKKQTVLALGRLGWSLRRIEQETRIRRETASQYLKAAGIADRGPRERQPPKPASGSPTDPAAAPAKPASRSTTDPAAAPAKPASGSTTDPAAAPAKPASGSTTDPA